MSKNIYILNEEQIRDLHSRDPYMDSIDETIGELSNSRIEVKEMYKAIIILNAVKANKYFNVSPEEDYHLGNAISLLNKIQKK